MTWLTYSEAKVWKKIYKKHRGETVIVTQIKEEAKTKGLKKKLFEMARKGWIVRINRGKYYIPMFDEILTEKKITINSLDDVKEKGKIIPLAVGLPANSEMYWYPVKKPQSLYAYEKHHPLIKTKYILKPLNEEMFKRSIDIDGIHMLSLEDTIIESLLDKDIQTAMAMVYRQKELIDWNYLINRIHEEHVEDLAYVSLEKFSQSNELRKYYQDNIPRMSDSFIKKVLRENTVYAMRHN